MSLMDLWNEVWKSAVLIISGMLLLRIAGRKSISQMTIPTTVIMVSIGTVIVQPIAEESIWLALASATVFILLLLAAEAVQIKWNATELFFRGRTIIVVRNGQIVRDALKKLRLTVDQLEMKLRQASISSISSVKLATIETNGQLGFELFPDDAPVTLKQVKELLAAYFPERTPPHLSVESGGSRNSVFAEIDQPGHFEHSPLN